MNQRRNNFNNLKIISFGAFLWVLWLFVLSCNAKPEHAEHGAMEHMHHDMKNMSDHSEHRKDTLDLHTITLPVDYSVLSSQKTVKPIWSDSNSTFSANGYISVDERRDNKVSARFSGRIEKLSVKYEFQYVKKGEKIMEIYSPEINTMQEELLLLLQDKSEADLVRKAEERLLWMGFSDSQLKEIESTGKALYSINILSPYDGYVYFTNATGSSPQPPGDRPSQMSGMEMQGSSSSIQSMAIPASRIREGSYVSKGQTLFRINDLKEVAAIVLIDNNRSSGISVGTNIEMVSELNNGKIIKAGINLLEPVLRNGQKFVSARVYLKNESGLLKVNSLLTAKINSVGRKQLLIPSSSILVLGKRNIVWLMTGEAEKGKYIFQVRDITTGMVHGNMTGVVGGLTDQDDIALDAGYMIDRESLIELR